MRLSKRIATTGLAVVMALSMLTACGGGGSAGGNSNNPSSKPNNPSSSVTGNENNGNGNTNNNGNTAGGSAAGSVWINTQTYKANQILKGNKEYLNSEWLLGNDSYLYEYSQNVQKSYMKERYYDNGVEKKFAMLTADGRVYIIEPKAVEGRNVILLASVDDYDQQEMMKQAAAMKTLLLQLLTPDDPSMITVEPQKQLGTSVYHAESYTKTVEGGKHYCYWILSAGYVKIFISS